MRSGSSTNERSAARQRLGALRERPPLEVRTPDLDDVFLALTGHSASQESSEDEEAETDHELEAVR